MIYQEFETHSGLSYYVQLVWMMESEHQKDQSPKSLVMPDGIVEIVFHYGDPWITTVGGDERAIQPHGLAISQMGRYIESDYHQTCLERGSACRDRTVRRISDHYSTLTHSHNLLEINTKASH